jgi:ATP-dependent Lon protease
MSPNANSRATILTSRTGINEFQKIANARIDKHGFVTRPVVPLHQQVIYPNVVTPISAHVRRAMAAIRAALDNRQTVLGVAQRNPETADLSSKALYTIGTEMALISPTRDLNRNTIVLAQGRRRVEIVEIIQMKPFLLAKARPIGTIPPPPEAYHLIGQQIRQMFKRFAELNPTMPNEVVEHFLLVNDPMILADMTAASTMLTFEEQQNILETIEPGKRLQQVAHLLAEKIKFLELNDSIHSLVRHEMDRNQREIYLREQMRVIQSELGENDIFQQEINEVRDRIFSAHLPEEIHERALKELSRLSAIPFMAPEVGIIRSYIDWLVELPWSQQTEDNLNISHVQKILDNQHWGLEKVKDRIVEYIAVRKLTEGKLKTPILCFLGPPGVGKTSLGKSIAEALERKFVRLSLGGVRDEAEIRGHRRTYVGALPGRIIQTMRRAGTINPVFVLDEIDKLSVDFRGDPASALLEVLDPEQNYAFSDHYLEVPYDLSKVLFITTANELDNMPSALIDRLEIIEFSGYTEEEKLAITQKFLIPRQIEAHGLRNKEVRFTKQALQHIIREYTYESGVRNLDREIANVLRKIARWVAGDKPYTRQISHHKLADYLGPPRFTSHRAQQNPMVGLATGLVWTYDGGDISMIEVSILPGKGALLMTGQLGEVMQESAQAALSYTRSRASDLAIPSEDFENWDIHIHLPEGAIPKEGPSAGITLAIAIISAFTERKIRSDYALTGEITLHGKVLAVGGIKEKVLAAHRAGIKNVILPSENKKDLIDIPEKTLNSINILLVNNMQEVINHVLLDLSPEDRKRHIQRQKAKRKNNPRKVIKKRSP